MKVTLSYNIDNHPNCLIIPIASNGDFEKAISLVAEHSGISKTLLKQEFRGNSGEIHTLYVGERRLYLVGLGENSDSYRIGKVFRNFSFKYKKKFKSPLGISFLHDNQPEQMEKFIEAASNGLLLGTYQIGRFKTTDDDLHPLRSPEAELMILTTEEMGAKSKFSALKGKVIAETQLSIFDLVNAPSNKKVPDDLASWAQASGKQYGYQVKVFDKKKIEAEGLEALLAVNRGSEHPPVFIIMEYKPEAREGNPVKKVGLVGKGVTFDTGGLSIKPSSNMHFMKSDMGGAAAVFGAMELAAKLKLPVHLFGIVPATDNSVDAKAIKPSDVINSYSGKTIEIIDTDAEGRLILADGLAYMVKHYQPEVLIDLATLTGSAVRTFGYHAAGLFSNNDQLAGQLLNAGQKSGERAWQLPIWDVYKDDIKSDIADVRNYSGKPMAGAIGAAKFLEFFISDHPTWAHLDIAGVAFSDTEFSSQKSATAFGVRLLIEYLSSI